MKRIKQRLLLAAIVFMCAAPIATYAQLDGGTEFDPPNENDLPIDGGVSLLLVAGIGYGAKKLYDKRKGGAESDNK
jgi:hypothetical protein